MNKKFKSRERVEIMDIATVDGFYRHRNTLIGMTGILFDGHPCNTDDEWVTGSVKLDQPVIDIDRNPFFYKVKLKLRDEK